MKRTVTVILLATTLLGLFSACGTAEPVPTETDDRGPTVISVEGTEDATQESTVQTDAGATGKMYSREEVDAEIRRELSDAIVNNYVLPGESFPEGLPMPLAVGIESPVADAYCAFGDNGGEVFVAYTSMSFGPAFIHEICYYNSQNYGIYWDRINLVLAEEIVGIYAIDRQHFIVLLDFYKNGYGIGIYENGNDLAACGMYAPMYRCDYPEIDLSYLFPAEDFVGAAEGKMDDGYVFFQSVTGFYCEDIDGESCRIVLEYEKDGVSHRRTAIYDINGIRPE